MRVVVVDDEPLARRGVRIRVARHADMQVIAECGTGATAVSAIRDLAPDLVLLDVQMLDMTGFDVLRELTAHGSAPAALPGVIFLTAFDTYAVRAFDVHALDYLLKPIDDERFASALERARERIESRATFGLEARIREMFDALAEQRCSRTYARRFAVRTGHRIVIVPVEDVDWIEATGDYATFHVGPREHLLRETISRLEEELDPNRFVRIHRSAIVQLSRIRELLSVDNREFIVKLVDGTKLRVSRTYSARVLARL